MKLIFLTEGHFSIVDDEDYEFINQFKWRYSKGRAIRTARFPGGKEKTIFMHRVIANTPEGMCTDHINGCPLDNRRSNLRVCTNQENMFNQRPQRGKEKSSRFKGVHLSKSNNKWRARIKVNQKYISLGYYDDEIQAAEAYNSAAKKYHGSFARLNEIK